MITIKADYPASIEAAPNLADDTRNARLKVSFTQDRQGATLLQLIHDNSGSVVASFMLDLPDSRLLGKLLLLR